MLTLKLTRFTEHLQHPKPSLGIPCNVAGCRLYHGSRVKPRLGAGKACKLHDNVHQTGIRAHDCRLYARLESRTENLEFTEENGSVATKAILSDLRILSRDSSGTGFEIDSPNANHRTTTNTSSSSFRDASSAAKAAPTSPEATRVSSIRVHRYGYRYFNGISGIRAARFIEVTVNACYDVHTVS